MTVKELSKKIKGISEGVMLLVMFVVPVICILFNITINNYTELASNFVYTGFIGLAYLGMHAKMNR